MKDNLISLIRSNLNVQNSDEIKQKKYSSYSDVYREIFRSFDKLIDFFLNWVEEIS